MIEEERKAKKAKFVEALQCLKTKGQRDYVRNRLEGMNEGRL